MAKKKSKTQKYKKNIKRKAKKIQSNLQTTAALETIEVVKEKIENKTTLKKEILENKEQITKAAKKVSSVTKEKKQKNDPKKIAKTTNTIKKENNKKEIELPKLKKDSSKKNIFIRLLYEIKNNTHIIFNALLIIAFIILMIGLLRIDVFKKGTIIYIAVIILFLMAVAISYNKYISGKIFTIILCIGMFFAIYQMQYTYDFIRNLNSNVYEYKTYYVVTFDTIQNKSIYNINNKNVGLLKDNCINIERKLNTKLDKVTYIEYDDINNLFDDFYAQEFRAILVNENQYKYLQNNIQKDQEVKILYEFKANAKK